MRRAIIVYKKPFVISWLLAMERNILDDWKMNPFCSSKWSFIFIIVSLCVWSSFIISLPISWLSDINLWEWSNLLYWTSAEEFVVKSLLRVSLVLLFEESSVLFDSITPSCFNKASRLYWFSQRWNFSFILEYFFSKSWTYSSERKEEEGKGNGWELLYKCPHLSMAYLPLLGNSCTIITFVSLNIL